MALLVQKYGGTSVGSVERLQAVAKRVAASKAEGHDLVVVVSAMGRTTDELTSLAKALNPHPPQRELDMLLATGEQVSIALLAMALQAEGVAAISMTGPQVGIVTESAHGRARILEVRTNRLQRHLQEGFVVVVAGFQGTSSGAGGSQEITTLGRGGSDTSAVALAAALGADACEIYTDVDGVLTTDPRKVPEAQLMAKVSCDEMLELASLGAAVLHPRAVEIARNYGVPLVVRSSWSDAPGTSLFSSGGRRAIGNDGLELGKPVDGAELLEGQAVLALAHIPHEPGIAARLFEALSSAGLSVDLIVQATHEGQSNDIAFTLDAADLNQATNVCRQLLGENCQLKAQAGLAKLSIAGAGIMGRPGVAAKLFDGLSQVGISLRMIATSEVKVSCLIQGDQGEKALRTTAQTFGLAEQQLRHNPKPTGVDQPEVRGVALDVNQMQLAVSHVPDQPGSAAALCRALADAGLSLDTIVQSERQSESAMGSCRDIAFTLPKDDHQRAMQALGQLIRQWPNAEIITGPAIARVSAVGAGMPATAGTAAKLFRALADAQINIEMIATSEIRISCVVAEADGEKALQAVHRAFGLER
ncbi:MAG: aspartate kinase [Synechococcaceae bacterium WBA_2_066]|nr:aspartate kinase [Synechococcaceae bacterium WB8_1A_041]NDC06459.1 aspartate kinase [Synechococcaceae bacterium WB9_2_069]NDE38290.1 aspartate kinase [Synechococcaceae bacterium WBA_2_066]